MTTFRIDADNNITALGASQQIEESGSESETFSNVQKLTAPAEKWFRGAARRDLEQLARCAARAAIHQPPSATTWIWKALQRLEPSGEAETGRVAAKRPSVGRKAPPAARKERGGNSTTTLQKPLWWNQEVALNFGRWFHPLETARRAASRSCDRSAATAPGGNAANNRTRNFC